MKQQTNFANMVVYLVDDTETDLALLKGLVSQLHPSLVIETFTNPVEALNTASSYPPDLLVTDYRMPELSGLELINKLHELSGCRDIPAVITTIVDDVELRYAALENGATDYLIKPYDHREIIARCRNLLDLRYHQNIVNNRALWLQEKVAEATKPISQREYDLLVMISNLTEGSPSLNSYGQRVARYCEIVAGILGYERESIRDLKHAATLANIGLIYENHDAPYTHCERGRGLLSIPDTPFLALAADIAYTHHEHFDGSGGPRGLAGKQIPGEARVFSVCDCYAAFSGGGHLYDFSGYENPFNYIKDQADAYFDPQVVEVFLLAKAEILHVDKRG